MPDQNTSAELSIQARLSTDPATGRPAPLTRVNVSADLSDDQAIALISSSLIVAVESVARRGVQTITDPETGNPEIVKAVSGINGDVTREDIIRRLTQEMTLAQLGTVSTVIDNYIETRRSSGVDGSVVRHVD